MQEERPPCAPLLTIDRRVFLAGAAAALGACSGRNENILRSTDTHPVGYPTVEAVREMGRILTARTQGRLSIKIYPGGQLGSERDTLEITAFGGLDLNRVNLAPLNSIEPLTIVPSLPFLFRTTAHMRAALDGPAGEEILASLEKHKLIGLCFYDSGERSFYNTRRPILRPSDMRGMKIRVPNSDLQVAMVRAFGADATPMSIAEVYQALVQGVIDGAENNWPSYESGRHFEPARFYSLSRHLITPEMLVMSKRRWDGLAAADRAHIRAAAKESVPYMRELWDARVAAAEARLREAGVAVNEVENQQEFVDLMRPVWDRFVTSPAQKRLVEDILSLGGDDA